MISCLKFICPCFFHPPRKRLSKTYLENLKDIQERKFSSLRKPTAELELLEVSPKKKENESLHQPLIEAPLLIASSEQNQPQTTEINSPNSSRDSLLKLEKFYENNIRNIFCKIKENALSSFEGYEKIHEDTKSQHNLIMYMKSELNEQKSRIFTFRTEWFAPCKPDSLVKFLNNYQEQFDLSDGKMEEYYPIKTFGKDLNFSIVYLKYKKVLTYSPRDFCYLRCHEQHDQEKNIWIDCSQSISNDLLPEYENIVRGNILFNGYFVEPINMNGKIFSKIRFYSQVDFKVSIPIFLSKTFGVMEMKKYIQKTYERIEELVKQDLLS